MALPSPARAASTASPRSSPVPSTRGAFPGAVILVAQRGEVLYHEAFGSRSLEPERTPMARGHDLRPVVAHQAARHHDRGHAARARGQAAARRSRDAVLPQLRRAREDARHLAPPARALLGAAGAGGPFYKDIAADRSATGGRTSSPAAARRSSSTSRSTASGSEYAAGHAEPSTATSASCCSASWSSWSRGTTLDRFCHERIFRPLGLRATGFIDLEPSAPRQARARSPTRSRRPSAARGGRRSCAARCTTTTPGRWAASPGTPGCSRPPRDVHALRLLAAGVRARRGRLPARGASCARSGRATGPCRTRPGRSAGTRRRRRRRAPARACARTPSAISASPARRSGSTSSATRTSILLTNRVHPDAPRRAHPRRCGRACTTRCGRRSTHEGAPDRRVRRRHERARGAPARGRPRVTGSDEQAYPPASTLLARPRHDGADAAGSRGRPRRRGPGGVRQRGDRATTPRRAAARERGLRTMSFPQALEELFLAGRRPLVVAGTHGKTTSASMLAWVLERAGAIPGLLIGGAPRDLPSSARARRRPVVRRRGRRVRLARSSTRGRSSSTTGPTTLLLTAVEFDHADIYRDLDAREGGVPEAARPARVPARRWWRAATFRTCSTSSRARAAAPQLFGLGEAQHVARDATCVDDGLTRFTDPRAAAARCARSRSRCRARSTRATRSACCWSRASVGIAWQAAAQALRDFRGVSRRQEVVGEARGVTVIDDFAHHPTAVAGTLAALRLRYPGRRLRAVFEPRSNTSRRRVFQREFADALAARRRGGPGGGVREAERSHPRVRAAVAGDHRRRGRAPRHPGAHDRRRAARSATTCSTSARSGDVIVIMSNGSFGGLPRLVADGLGAGA